MAKNSITDYSKTAASNTDIQSVDIDEGCLPSGINNAIREIMADLADMNDGTVSLTSPAFTSVDINGGTIDGAVIGGASAAAGTFTTGQFNTSLNVDGTVTADGLTVDGNATIQNTGNSYRTISLDANRTAAVNTLGRLNYKWDGNEVVRLQATSGFDTANKDNGSFTIFTSDDGTLDQRLKIDSDGDISFYEDTGTTAKLFWDASAERLGLGTSSPSALLNAVDASGSGTATQIASGTAHSQTRFAARTDGYNGIMSLYDSGGTEDVKLSAKSGQSSYINNGGNVGIGTTSPAIYGVDNADDLVIGQADGNHGITISSYGTSNGTLAFSDQSNATVGRGFVDYDHNVNAMSFGTLSTERMRIDSSGNVLVGTTSYNNDNAGIGLGASNFFYATRSGNLVGSFNRLSSDGDIIDFRKDGTTVGSIGTQGGRLTIGDGDTGLRFADDFNNIQPFNVSTNALRDNAINLGSGAGRFKSLFLSGGVYLGGTGGANHLDDYEEGTWTPVFRGMTFNNQDGHYVKIGKLVHCTAMIAACTSGSASSSNAFLDTLPFTVADNLSNTSLEASGFASYWNDIAIGVSSILFAPVQGLTACNVYFVPAAGVNTNAVIGTLDRQYLDSSSMSIRISITYIAA